MRCVPELISTVDIFLLETEYDGTQILDYKLFESALKPEAPNIHLIICEVVPMLGSIKVLLMRFLCNIEHLRA